MFKTKVFHGSGLEALSNDMNEWLKGQKQITIKHLQYQINTKSASIGEHCVILIYTED
jgi:hypothetical protein